MNDFDHFKEIRFIGDEPANADEFQGGAHARVAKTLAGIITSMDGGRAIGLEGTWGSGKSTVVDFAKTALEDWSKNNSPKHSIFVFDAWAHQGDPLRRVFLDSLIADLAGKLVDETKWKRKLEELRSLRKKVTESKAEKLSWVARVSLLTLPLFPLAYLLLAEWLKSPKPTITLPPFGDVSKGVASIVILSILIAPYAAALFTWLWRLNKKEMRGKSIIVAFTRQTDQVTTEQLIREDEATTTEFNVVFDELLEDAKARGNRLVIVLDNLDRLANEQIRDIWATMRNFFAATPGSKRRATLKNVWLIVPIDRQHIEAVFADPGQNAADQNARGFVEKTFEVMLRVPPPLLSNWREFFSKKIKEAFGDKISPSETYRIFRLFELHQTIHPRSITPRVIKSHVNKIVAQAKLSGDTIPLEFQALYVIYKDEIAGDIRRLQDSSILDDPIRATVTSLDWTKYLAAAHFNVLPDQALELLLAQEIEATLLAHDSNRLGELTKTSGFTSVLHNVLAVGGRKWATESPSQFFDVSYTLNELKIDDVATEHIWRDFIENVTHINNAVVATDLSRLGVAALVGRAPSERKAAIAWAVRKALTIRREDLTEGFEQAGVAWFLMIEALIGAAEDIDPRSLEDLSKQIPIFENVQFFLGVAEHVSKSKLLRLANFSVPIAAAEISSALSDLVSTAEPPPKLINITTALLEAPKLVNWASYMASIQTRLQTNNPPLKSGSASLLLNLIHLARNQKPAATVLKALVDDGSIWGLIQIGRNESDLDLMSIAIDKLIDLKAGDWSGPAEHPQYGQLAAPNEFLQKIQTTPASEPGLLEKLSRRTYDLGGFVQVLSLALPGNKKHEIFREMFRLMTDYATEEDLDVHVVSKNFDRVIAILGDDRAAKLIALLKKLDLTKSFSDSPESWKEIQPAFLEQLKSDSIKLGEAAEVIQVGLDKLSIDMWSAVLAAEGNELKLVLDLIELEKLKPLSTVFFDAIRGHFAEIIDGRQPFAKSDGRWKLLPNALSDSQRPFFYRAIRDDLLNKRPNVEIIVGVLALLGPEFLRNSDLSDRGGSTVVSALIDPLLAGASADSLSALETNADVFADLIERADTQTIDFIVGRASDLFLTLDEPTKLRLLQIAARLGFKIIIPDAVDEGEEGA